MTPDLPGTTPTEAPDPADASTAAPAKPPRRRATRKAAAPAVPEPAVSTDSEAAPATTEPATAEPATTEPTAEPATTEPAAESTTAEATTTEPAAESTTTEPTAEPATEAPARRATRSRRATSATTADGAAPKRATRSRAAKAPAADAAPPALDVLAELGLTQPAPPVEAEATDAAEPADIPAVDATDATVTEAIAAGPAEDADVVTQDEDAVADEDTVAPVADEDTAAPVVDVTPEPRLATTALLFQAPDPTAARPRRRRVVAPAGPPQLVVPEVILPQREAAPTTGRARADAPTDTSEPIAVPTTEPTGPTTGPAAGPVAEAPAEPRRRGRRATRTTAAPAPTAAEETAAAADAATTDEAAVDESALGAPAEPTPSRRGSRRRGSRAAALAEETDVDALDDEIPAALPGDDLDVTEAEPDEDDEDDETAEGGAPRRRRRRGGRGRRSRSAGDGDAARPTADAEAGDEPDHDEDEDEDVAGHDAEGEDGATEAGEGDEAGGTSRRRRRRRRSGRGGDTAETDAEVAPSARAARTPRAPSDEVTALRGSTRLEAKRQRRREGRDAGRRRQIITESEFLARRESVDRTMVVREQDGRTQIAVLEDGVLVEHYVSRQAQVSMAGNVYLGRVQNVLPSMEAAFVDVGKGRNAVLYAGEVNWDAAGLEGQPRRIEQALKSGDSVLVQVTKDPIGHKGARLTSQITLAGRYLVYVPGGGMTGISRKLPDNERARLKKLLREIVPDTAGVIVRTAAEGASEDELRADILRLQEQWTAIEKKAKTASAPALLQGEPDLAIRVVRDIFNDDFSSLVVQGDEAWQTISGYIGALAPDLAQKVTRWTAEGDVFAAHRVDEQLAKGMDRKVWLPSGGSLVIDRTEAMTVVDVNTGKFTGSGGTLEETVTRNNLEAAEEIVRQLRLRDIGGIIVIDFIDMVLELNRDLVLRRLVECLGRDRTKHQVAEVTSLGLVQMTRKRVGQGLVEAFSETCEHCNGRGFIVHTDPIERGGPPQIQVQTPQPPMGGGDTRGGSARRRRGSEKPGSSVPSGLPMVPVLPEAREAVKATLATIAAAAAHAHEHEHNGHGPAGGTTPAPPAPADVVAASPVRIELPAPVGQPADTGSAHPDASAAVTEALAALRMPAPAAEQSEAPDVTPADDGVGLDPAAVTDDVTPAGEASDGGATPPAGEASDGAATPTADAESVFATPEWIDVDLGDTEILPTDASPDASGEALRLVPVAPEVFADPGEQGGDGAGDGGAEHEGEDGPVHDVGPGSPTTDEAPDGTDLPHPADGDVDEQ